MPKRKKRLKKSIESLGKRIEEHKQKIYEEKKKPNYNYALVEYWGKDIKGLRLEKEKKEKLLKK